MAPNRLRAGEDSRSESSGPTGRQGGGATSSGVAKGKRAANNQTGSNLKDVTNIMDSQTSGATAGAGGGNGGGGGGIEGASSGINWNSFDHGTLDAYRHAYRLATPACFASLHHQAFLRHPNGLGAHAPSMVRPRAQRRVPKETLAMAVRKDFNAAAVNEAEVVTSFLYAVQNQDKHFRMRFAPPKK